MPSISQHEAAELWELSRDHFLCGAKLAMMSQTVHDPQLRGTLEQQARRFQQVAQQLDSFLHQGGAHLTGLGGMSQGQQQGAFMQGTGAHGQQHLQAQTTSWQGTPYTNAGQGAVSPTDLMVAGDCLKDCKSLAIQCIIGATEASQPARNFLYQLAGEHLQMADVHYRWLEQRGFYASPRADQTALREYDQKLHQIAQNGQQVTMMRFQAAQPAFQYGQPFQGQTFVAGYAPHAQQPLASSVEYGVNDDVRQG